MRRKDRDERKREVDVEVIIREGEGDLCWDKRGAQQTSGPLGFP